jgi:hypothetical protein
LIRDEGIVCRNRILGEKRYQYKDSRLLPSFKTAESRIPQAMAGTTAIPAY